MMPRLYIVDDETPARTRLRMLLSDIAVDCPHQLIGEAANPRDALQEIAEKAPDIVLLDVQMPGMTGLELAAHLAKLPAAPAVIFVSAYDEYALKAFDVHALDYLLKPVRAARLSEAIARAIRLKPQPAQAGQRQDALAAAAVGLRMARKHFSVQERGRMMLVPVAEVIYLKAELKYVTVKTKVRDYLIEESLQSIEDEMAAVFVRVHRNALVARDAIIGVERGVLEPAVEADGEKSQEAWQVILRDVDDRLPISRRQWQTVKALVR
jgi:two-component system, LytTR family, response regulator AlgR